MLEKVKIRKVIPKGNGVLIHIKRTPKTTASGLYIGTENEFSSSRMDIDNYTGKVEAIGYADKVEEGCPGLKVGDTVIVSQFAGYHIPTKREVFAKIVHATDIHCKTHNSMKLELDKLEATGSRLLLEIKNEDDQVSEGGIIMGKQESDPNAIDTQRCEVWGVGPTASEYQKGDIVYIPAYVGNIVILDNGMMVKTVNFNDVLFMLERD